MQAEQTAKLFQSHASSPFQRGKVAVGVYDDVARKFAFQSAERGIAQHSRHVDVANKLSRLLGERHVRLELDPAGPLHEELG